MPANAVGAGFCGGDRVVWRADGGAARTGPISTDQIFVFAHDEFVWLPSERGHDCIVVKPSDGFLSKADALEQRGTVRLRPTAFEADPMMHKILALMREEVLAGSQMGALYQDSLLNLLALRLLRYYAAQGEVGRQRTRRLCPLKQRRVVDYMKACLADDITVEKLAELVPMSPFYFARAFKETFGKPPHQYLTQLRMTHALTLLISTRASLTEIAAEVGYASTSHFGAQFVRAMGFSPHEARAVARTRSADSHPGVGRQPVARTAG